MSPFHGLESKQIKGRISTAAPQILAYLLQSLRPILHITCPDSMISYSKGSRGLFVPSRVIGIFTDTTISLSSRLRQRPDHYTIRAGRNLPDKEFRYLRTVIVTAAVYWGFNSTFLLSMTSPRFGSHGGFACHDRLLHPLTTYSVRWPDCHFSVSTSLLKVVTEY